MQHIFIDNEQLDIDIILQRQWGRYAELLLGTCGITDRCGYSAFLKRGVDEFKFVSFFTSTGAVQIHASTKAGASSPGTTLFVCVRIQVIKEKCATCVSADR